MLAANRAAIRLASLNLDYKVGMDVGDYAKRLYFYRQGGPAGEFVQILREDSDLLKRLNPNKSDPVQEHSDIKFGR